MKNYKHGNKLINETSPYLLQHAHNPVDWYPWGEEALQKAKDENKVMLVSIGYSACHWCHVMERESFEDVETAKLMNASFVNIKIDREERPDIDHIYMDAVQAMTGSGGWPLNVFLTPDAKPFYGGTYFPPVPAFNRTSWKDVLEGVNNAWTEKQHEVIAQAENLTAYLNNSSAFTKTGIIKVDGGEDRSMKEMQNAVTIIMQMADKEWGGFGKAPKFPQTFTIQFLLQYHYYTKDQPALEQALLSIDKMLMGGIYDHIGGGLARYSTDNEWLAPHFEKMLYDNALFVSILCDAYQIAKNDKYKKAIEKTLAFILNELTDVNGAFYAALDADSEGVEGKYYVWQKSEIDECLGSDSGIFCELFDISSQGNWEHSNIPRLLLSIEEFALTKNMDVLLIETLVEKSIVKLKEYRGKRTRPGLDDKVLLSWNALMLKAFAKAAIVLGSDVYKQASIRNAAFLVDHFEAKDSANKLFHTWKNGQAKYPGFLDDYAFMIEALLQLYDLTFNSSHLLKANEYCKYVIEHFSDEEGIFFYYTGQNQKDVIVRKKEVYDGATPSANAVMAGNLLKLSIIFDEPEWRSRAAKMLDIIAPAVIKYPVSFGMWGSLLLQRIRGMNELAIFGENGTIAAQEMLHENYFPHKLIIVSDNITNGFPFLKGKKPGEPLFTYLCKNQVCFSPLAEIKKLLDLVYDKDKF